MAALWQHSAARLTLIPPPPPPPPPPHAPRRPRAPFLSLRCMAASKLFVGGLSSHTDEKTLRDAFTPHGEISEVKIIFDRDTGISRGFCFITFNTESEAVTALREMDGQIVQGRVIRVDYATDKPKDGRGSGFQRRSSISFQSGWADGMDPEDEDDRKKSGWLENSPSVEDFGPIYPKIVFGPKMLQGGYEYIPPPQLLPYVAPASSSVNSRTQKTPAVILSNDPGHTSGHVVSSGSPIGGKIHLSFPDDSSPLYQKSSPHPVNDTDIAYSKFPRRISDGISPAFTGSSISPGTGSSNIEPGFSDDIGLSHQEISYGLSRATPSSPSKINHSNDIGTIYSKSSSSFASGSAYPTKMSDYSDASPSVKSNTSLSNNIYPAYRKDGSSLSGGSADSKSSVFLGGPSGTKSNLNVSDDGDNASRYMEDPDFPGAYVDRYSNPKHRSIFADNSPPYSLGSSRSSTASADRRSKSSLPRNTGPAFVKSSTEFPGLYGDNKTNHNVSEIIDPAYSKSTIASLGGPVNVKSSPGVSKDIGPAYPNGGYSYSFATSVGNNHSEHKIQNSDPAYSDTSSGHGGF